MVSKVNKIWLDGELVPWDQANVHVLTHTLHYGLGTFEGIRCYKLTDGKSAIFRLVDHIERLFHSSHIVTIPMPWSREQVAEACIETVRVNGFDECYIRPLVFLGDGAMGLGATQNATRLAIVAWHWGAYLGDEALDKGIRACVSSFARPGINQLMAKGKVVGHYVNSILAKREAAQAGYDEAVLLDSQGYVAEATGQNIFLVRGGAVVTPPYGSSILGGITRDTVLQLLKEMQIPVEERLVARDELYISDEVFVCGTATEVIPVREVDHRTVGRGAAGPVTKKLQRRFFEIVRDPHGPHARWLTPIT